MFCELAISANIKKRFSKTEDDMYQFKNASLKIDFQQIRSVKVHYRKGRKVQLLVNDFQYENISSRHEKYKELGVYNRVQG